MDWQNGPENRPEEQNTSSPQPPVQPTDPAQPVQGGWAQPYGQPYPQPQQPVAPQPQSWQQPPVQGQNPATGYAYGQQPPPPVQSPVPPPSPYGYDPNSNPYAPRPQGNWTTVPYYPPQQPGGPQAPYGQPPVYRAPQAPVQAAPQPVDTTRPLMVMASHRVTKAQYHLLNNPNGGLMTGIQVVLGLLILIFGAIAVVNGIDYMVNDGEWLAFIVCSAVTVAALAVLVWRTAFSRRKRRKVIDEAYACACESGDGNSITELYMDRAESITSRGRCVVRYAEATLTEYADMLVLSGPGAAIVWRAEDVSAAQMQAIQSVIYPQMRQGARKSRGVFYPKAFAPLPIPTVVNDDEVRVTFHVGSEKPLGAVSTGKRYLYALPSVLALLAIFSVYMANGLAITPSILIDLLLYLLIFWAGGALLLLLLVALLRSIADRNELQLPAAYAFTRDGLARQWGGGTLFIPASHVKPQIKPDGIQLGTPYGMMKIRWTDIEDRERESITAQLQNFGPQRAAQVPPPQQPMPPDQNPGPQ